MAAKVECEAFSEKLIEKSLDAFVMALETINRISVRYRLESFLFLICNAWELMLKGKAVRDAQDIRVIYFEGNRTHDLRLCLRKAFADGDPVRLNVEKVADLRDEATHLVISEIPREIMGLFQSCVLNYHRLCRECFQIDFSKRLSMGMMTIVYDFAPSRNENAVVLKEEIGKHEADFLTRYCADLHRAFEELGRPPEFMIDVSYKLVLTKNAKDADISLTSGPLGAATQIVEVPKDPGRTHPYRRKDALEEINRVLSERGYKAIRLVAARIQKKYRFPKVVNEADIHRMCKNHNVKQRSDLYYQGTVSGSPAQYSKSFVDWIIREIEKNPSVFRVQTPLAGTNPPVVKPAKPTA